MAQLPDVIYNEGMVSLKRALGITTCAMTTVQHDDWLDYKPAIEYALWQVQENLCDTILDYEEEVSSSFDVVSNARQDAFEQAARLVERFNDSPVVIPPNGSFTEVIARAIRQLATNEEEDDYYEANT